MKAYEDDDNGGVKVGGSVKATFEIGRNSKDCGGIGICTKKGVQTSVEIKVEEIKITNKSTQNALDRSEIDNSQLNVVLINNIDNVLLYTDEANKIAMNEYMNSDLFIIEEDVYLTIDNINLKEYKVTKGNYEYKYDEARGLYYLEL